MSNIERHQVFISYARDDYWQDRAAKTIIPGNIVSQIKQLLTDMNISYWFDDEGIYAGHEFMDIIADEIEKADLFIFVSTEKSNSSPWARKELSLANYFEKHIIPIKVSEKYTSKIGIWLSDVDFIDHFHFPDQTLDKLKEAINSYFKEKAKDEHKKQLDRETQRREDKQKYELLLKSYAEYIILLTQEIESINTQLNGLNKELEMRETSVALINDEIKRLEIEVEKIDSALKATDLGKENQDAEIIEPGITDETVIQRAKVLDEEEASEVQASTPAPAAPETEKEADIKQQQKTDISKLISLVNVLRPATIQIETDTSAETSVSETGTETETES